MAYRDRVLACSRRFSYLSSRKRFKWEDLLFAGKVVVLRIAGAKNDCMVKLAGNQLRWDVVVWSEKYARFGVRM